MMDFSFLDDEDFGLAKSFSSAPVTSLAPQYPYDKKDSVEVEKQVTDIMDRELVSDGFCFKLAPCEDVSLSKLNQLFLNYSN
jgi:hypothetical protein